MYYYYEITIFNTRCKVCNFVLHTLHSVEYSNFILHEWNIYLQCTKVATHVNCTIYNEKWGNVKWGNFEYKYGVLWARSNGLFVNIVLRGPCVMSAAASTITNNHQHGSRYTMFTNKPLERDQTHIKGL